MCLSLDNFYLLHFVYFQMKSPSFFSALMFYLYVSYFLMFFPWRHFLCDVDLNMVWSFRKEKMKLYDVKGPQLFTHEAHHVTCVLL